MGDNCFCDYEPATFYMSTFTWHGKRCRTCCRCLAVREYVKAHVPCFCWLHHSMLDDARDTIESYAHELPGMFMAYGRLRVAVNRGLRWTVPV
jgi:hypothetical protein